VDPDDSTRRSKWQSPSRSRSRRSRASPGDQGGALVDETVVDTPGLVIAQVSRPDELPVSGGAISTTGITGLTLGAGSAG
jgi:hypothetical protein